MLHDSKNCAEIWGQAQGDISIPPQANGQVESTNKTLENILTKTVAYHLLTLENRTVEDEIN